VQQCTGATRQGLDGLDHGGELTRASAKVAGEYPPRLQLGVGAFAKTSQAGLGTVGGLLRFGQGLLAALALVPGDDVRVQSDVAKIGQQAEELQNLVGYLEASGGRDVDGPAGQNTRHPQQFAIGGGHGLHRAAMTLVLS
jgi:hypothetical protein